MNEPYQVLFYEVSGGNGKHGAEYEYKTALVRARGFDEAVAKFRAVYPNLTDETHISAESKMVIE